MRRTLFALLLVGCAHVPVGSPLDGPAAPRPLMPVAETVNVARPLFKWKLARGTTGALLEVYADPHRETLLYSANVTGNSARAGLDFSSGPLYWQLRGTAGAQTGKVPTAMQVFTVDLRIQATTKHVLVVAPREEIHAAAELATLGDRAMELWSKTLGFALRDEVSNVFIYSSWNEFQDAARDYSGMWTPHNLSGFTNERSSHLPFIPRVGRAASDSPGALEFVVLHELGHAFQHKSIQMNDALPAWLIEGFADYLAEIALAELRGVAGTQLPFCSQRLRLARVLDEQGKLLPLDRFLDEEREAAQSDQREVQARVYAEGYALVHFLGSPANPERAAHFREFLRDVLSSSKILLAQKIKRSFQKSFGDFAAVDAEFRAALRAEPLFPWLQVHNDGDLRAEPDGALWVESAVNARETALAETRCGPSCAIDADVESAGGGVDRAAEVVFGFHSPKDFYRLSLRANGKVNLAHYTGQWTTLAKLDGRLAASAHHVTLALEPTHVAVAVDGQPLLDTPLIAPIAGRWGVGAWNGSARFKGAAAK